MGRRETSVSSIQESYEKRTSESLAYIEDHNRGPCPTAIERKRRQPDTHIGAAFDQASDR